MSQKNDAKEKAIEAEMELQSRIAGILDLTWSNETRIAFGAGLERGWDAHAGMSTPSTDAEDVSIEPQNVVSAGEADIDAILEAIEKRDGDGMIVLSESKLEALAAHCRQMAVRIAELSKELNRRRELESLIDIDKDGIFDVRKQGNLLGYGPTVVDAIDSVIGYEVAQKAAKEGK